jgi:hypothetical protein
MKTNIMDILTKPMIIIGFGLVIMVACYMWSGFIDGNFDIPFISQVGRVTSILD